MSHFLSRLVLPGILTVMVALPAHAQVSFPPTSPRFVDVLRLAQETYTDSARATIQRIITGMSPTDPAYAEALYTSASIPAKTLDETRRLFSQVATDYSASPWAPKAYYRLAQIEYGLNQIDASIIAVKRIFADYGTSPVVPAAALWGARAAFQKNELQLGCDWIRKGLAAVGNDIELKNSLEYTRGRCAVGAGVELAPVVPESLRAGPPPATSTKPPAISTSATVVPPPPPPTVSANPAATNPKPVVGTWRVQVAAITNKAAIQRTVAKIKSLGLTAYQVNAGGSLVKVQAGPFATKEAAQAQVARLTKAIGGKLFVVQVP